MISHTQTTKSDLVVCPDLAPHPAHAAAPPPLAPGVCIRYHPELIEQLRQNHLELLGLVAHMEQLALEGDLPGALAQLPQFKRQLQACLLLANVRLYVYLEHLLPRQHPGHQVVRSARHSLNTVSAESMAFVERQLRLQATRAAVTPVDFMHELSTVAQLMVSQIQQEEDLLYPLYRPQPPRSALT
jgi:hypothetical protein